MSPEGIGELMLVVDASLLRKLRDEGEALLKDVPGSVAAARQLIRAVERLEAAIRAHDSEHR